MSESVLSRMLAKARRIEVSQKGPAMALVMPDLLGMGNPIFFSFYGGNIEEAAPCMVEAASDFPDDERPLREPIRHDEWADQRRLSRGRGGRRPRYKDVRRGCARIRLRR